MDKVKFEKAKVINDKLQEIYWFNKWINDDKVSMALVKPSDMGIHTDVVARFIMLKDELKKFIDVEEENLRKEFEEL